MTTIDRWARVVVIDYTNHRGERAERLVYPITVAWGSNQWHRDPQHLLVAYDLDKLALREFAFAGIHSWRRNADPIASEAEAALADACDRSRNPRGIP